MSAKVLAPINPKVLSWARSESGYGLAPVAAKLRVSPQKLSAWESGEEQPTLRQVEKLAAVYHRPLPVFFLPSPPKVTPLASEFRRLPGVVPGEESPELRIALRTLRRRRQIALELLEENEETPGRPKLSAHLQDNPEDVGSQIRKALRIEIEQQRRWKNDYDAWRAWRDRVELFGILVFQIPGVPLRQMRGVSFLLDPLPVIGVNSKDHPLARAFTLIHELTHIMLRIGGDERPAAEETRSPSDWAQVERFADATAAATLMPRDAILQERLLREKKSGAQWTTEEITSLARRYRVGPVAMMTRLVTLNRVTWQFYKTWRADWEAKWDNLPKAKKTGGPSRVDTILSRVGPTYAALVIDSLARDLITPLAAADALDLKPRHFDSLKQALITGTDLSVTGTDMSLAV